LAREEKTIMKRSPDGNSLYGAQPTKKMRINKSNENEVMFKATTSTAACNESQDDGLMSQQNTEGKITRIPCELLECILLKLSYDEVSRVRQVCRQFREVGNRILNMEFLRLKKYVESQLAAVVKEENTLSRKTLQSGTGSTGRAENISTGPEAQAPKDQLTLVRCRGLLNIVCSQIRFLRAVSYRFLFLSDVPPNIRFTTAFFAGKIIDEIHRILRHVRLRQVERKDVDACVVPTLVDKWILFFTDGIEPKSIKHISKQNKSKYTDLFGSRVIDLLECILNCKKNVTVSNDSGGWCYIKGEYRVSRSHVGYIIGHDSGIEPLDVKEQRTLHSFLYNLARAHNFFYIKKVLTDDENALGASDVIRVPVPSYKGMSECRKTRYAYIICNEESCTDDCKNGEDPGLTLRVDLKCRMELAPVEMLLEFRKVPSCDQNEVETAASTDTVQDSSPNFELQLDVECRQPVIFKGRILPSFFKCLIKQGHTQLEAPMNMQEEEDIVIPALPLEETTYVSEQSNIEIHIIV
jgi:hypothetical protein